jgi:hypothetical protein
MKVVLVLAAIAVARWLWLILAEPLAPCPLCHGTGKRGRKRHRRFGRCLLCKGRGERIRLGARTVHKMIGRKIGDRR